MILVFREKGQPVVLEAPIAEEVGVRRAHPSAQDRNESQAAPKRTG